MARRSILVYLICFMLAGAPDALGQFEITLTNGRRIKSVSYWEDGEMFCFEKYGSIVQIPTSSVKHVREITRDTAVRTVQPDKALHQKPSAEKTARNSRTRSKKPTIDDQIATLKKSLASYQKDKIHHCENARYKSGIVPRAPSIPVANRSIVGKETADRYKDHIRATVEAGKAGKLCEYYSGMVDATQEKLNKLIRIRYGD